MIVRTFLPTLAMVLFFSCSEMKEPDDTKPNQPVEAANFEYKSADNSSESAHTSNAHFFDVSVNHSNKEKVYHFNLSNKNSKYRYVQSANKTMLVPMDMKNKYSGSIVFEGEGTGEFELTGGYGTPSVIINVDPATVGYALKDGKLTIEKYEENGYISGHFEGVAENTNNANVRIKGAFRIKTE